MVSTSRNNRLPPKSRTRALSPTLDVQRHVSKKRKSIDTRAPTPPIDPNTGDDADFMMNMDDKIHDDNPQPSSPVARAVERKQVTVKAEEDDDDDMMEVAQAEGIATASVNISGTRPVPKIKKIEPYPSPASSSPVRAAADRVDAASWNNVTQNLNVMNSSQSNETATFGKLDYNDAIEEDGNLNFFWTDYTEVNGSLCLFGKVKTKKNGAHVSCFVKVDNIFRKLFFLPREYRQQNKRDTDEEIGMKDVYKEVDDIMGKMKVGEHKIKPCTRKYAFEHEDVPKEAEYLKLLYPYSSKSNPSLRQSRSNNNRTATATRKP
jgi:DNA polymerase alpha subunit A